MNTPRKLFSFLTAAVLTMSMALQCAGTVSAAEQQPPGSAAEPEVSASGSSAVGEVLAESINSESKKLMHAEGFNIYAMNAAQSEVTVSLSAPEDCKLVVGVYTDEYADGVEKLSHVGTADVRAGDESVTVTFQYALPEYYVLKSYMIGSDGNLLSEEFVDETNTKDIQLLKLAGIDSFKDYEVINLDDQDNTNFVVYKKDVKVLYPSETENILTVQDTENGIYTIRSLSTEISEGDMVSVQGDGADAVIFRVQSLETDGDETTVHADPAADPSDAYAFIKVELQPEDFAAQEESAETAEPSEGTEQTEQSEGTEQTEQSEGTEQTEQSEGTEQTEQSEGTEQTEQSGETEETPPSGQKPAEGKPLEKNAAVPEDEEDLWSGSKSLTLEQGVDGFNIPGLSRRNELKPAHFKCGINWNYAFAFNYYSTETHTTSKLYLHSEIKLDLSVEATLDFYIPIPEMAFKFEKCGLRLAIGLFAKMELTGALTGTVTLSTLIDSTGYHTDADIELAVKAELYVGIAIVIKGKAFGTGIEAEVGAGAYATFTVAEPHPVCFACADIELGVKGYFECKAGISFWGLEWEAGISGELTLKIADAYFSDKLGFGLDTCPNKHISGKTSSGSPGGQSGTTPEKPDDGLTDEQREYLTFTIGELGGYAVSVAPDHADDIVSIDIPAEYMGKPVTMIGTGYPVDGIFWGCDKDGVNASARWIRNSDGRTAAAGFYECKNLKSIHLPETIRSIGAYAFCGCTALEQINLPDSITRIEQCAFVNCTNMKLQNLPRHIHELGLGAFMGCESAFETLVTPNTLTRMGTLAFAHCHGIRKVIWNVQAVPENTFYYCSGLKSLTIQEPTVAINKHAFFGCSNLSDVRLAESLHYIGQGAFQRCEKLYRIDLPDELYSLSMEVFRESSLTALTIPPCMTNLDSPFLLYANNRLGRIVLPATVEKINFMTFWTVINLDFIIILNPNAEFAELDEDYINPIDCFYRKRKTIYGYAGSTTEAFCKKYGFRFEALVDKPVEVVSTGTNNPRAELDPPQTMVFENLEPNTLYNFYDLLGEEFSDNNLLFLSQGMSDSNGTLTVWYRSRHDDSEARKFVKCYETEDAPPAVFGAGFGDLNGDNQIDVSDAVLLARFCAEDPTAVISAGGLQNADVNHDNKKDADDVILILQYIVHLVTSFE